MGICSSKPSDSSKHDIKAGPSAQQAAGNAITSAEQQVAGAAGTAAQTPEGAAQDPTSAEPSTPQPVSGDADGDGEEHPGLKQVHKYNSMEKPYRSAMRPSDAKSDTYSRRSSSGMSNVGFSVSTDAPDSEQHRMFAGADSISLKKIVDMFYDKVLADPKLHPFFAGIDMSKLKRHQVRFMGLAFGGKELVFEEDPNLNLRKVHYRLIQDKGLNLSHWELFVGHFDETMEQLEKEIPLATRQAASKSIRATRHYFVPIGQETEYTNASIGDLPEAEVAVPESIPEVPEEEVKAA